MILLVCLVVLLALGAAEQLALVRARRAVPIRIHVNGTRGKSTVTRLVAAALREAGVPTLAKVTGTAPRLILPDGSERPVVRRSPANIREQGWVLRQAHRCHARALVVECMAVRPELQWASEHALVRATVGVITNARHDHTEVMGTTSDSVALSLSNTVPRNGTLIVGDPRFAPLFAARANAFGTQLVVALPFDAAARAANPDREAVDEAALRKISPDPMTVGVALAVTRQLGIEDELALRGMRNAAADPGAVARGTVAVDGRTIEWIDATAANDPESLDLILHDARGPHSNLLASSFDLYVYNHRSDRAPRLATFATASRSFSAAPIILLTGERPPLLLAARLRRECPRSDIRYVKPRRLAGVLAATVRQRPSVARIIYCGNTRGFVRPSFTAGVADS